MCRCTFAVLASEALPGCINLVVFPVDVLSRIDCDGAMSFPIQNSMGSLSYRFYKT